MVDSVDRITNSVNGRVAAVAVCSVTVVALGALLTYRQLSKSAALKGVKVLPDGMNWSEYSQIEQQIIALSERVGVKMNSLLGRFTPEQRQCAEMLYNCEGQLDQLGDMKKLVELAGARSRIWDCDQWMSWYSRQDTEKLAELFNAVDPDWFRDLVWELEDQGMLIELLTEHTQALVADLRPRVTGFYSELKQLSALDEECWMLMRTAQKLNFDPSPGLPSLETLRQQIQSLSDRL